MIDARVLARKALLGAARYSGVSSLASPLLSGAGAILMLHRVSSVDMSPLGINSHLSITPKFLDSLLAELKRRSIAILPLEELLKNLTAARSGRAVSITADDAYLDNLTEALPVFEAHSAPFTIYVAPGLTSGEVIPWWEALEEYVARRDVVDLPTPAGIETLECGDAAKKREAARRLMHHFTAEIAEEDQQAALRRIGVGHSCDVAPGRRFMNWDEVRRLQAHSLATIGAHTVHHYNLKRLSADKALQEMVDSATTIEIETGVRPSHFAFPYGYESAVGSREVDLARQAGFASAVTTRHGVLYPAHADHLHALPRISVNGHLQRLAYMQTLLSGLTTPLANRGRRLVTV